MNRGLIQRLVCEQHLPRFGKDILPLLQCRRRLAAAEGLIRPLKRLQDFIWFDTGWTIPEQFVRLRNSKASCHGVIGLRIDLSNHYFNTTKNREASMLNRTTFDALLCKYARVQQVSSDDVLFGSGINISSIGFTEFIMELEEVFDLDIDLDALDESVKTVEQLYTRLSEIV